ncbi:MULTISPECIES: archaetidylserine decarboxylase [Corallococcus]|uniref:Phosphatidylserine decarboxylase proenzyme n=2 Tax=Corallococcus TaxID=83461 RepID=A0A7Y4NGF5_9BACT|nr:archaetidylserine decarboxylase [Corallococcus exercitus]NOK13014.1 phosphatidylserine decarboxylase [Corallococcus exercitus]GMU05574.1 archaetidylserine decarboxylase [Corallococcus sp. NO1]
MNEQTFMKLMRVLPKSAVSSVVGLATRLPAPAPVHHWAMRTFAKAYNVDMEEAEHSFEKYPTFAQFFTRGLKPGLRPVDGGEKVVVSPVDGRVSQVGYSDNGRCLQAKGIEYTVDELLGDSQAAKPFHGGAWTTLYLSPRDYHRIHAPLGGTITGYAYIPGEFWPVNPASVKNKQSLFCVNERLVTYLDTVAGKVAVVKVGATCVSRIKASYEDITTHLGQPGKVHRYGAGIPVEKGGELGRFEMGSTVILCFEPGRVRWDDSMQPEAVVRMGTRIGVIT